MKYLPEIDGLRAVSVIAVLVYHLGANWLPGGFTGVDIFFVISGFLITSIIHEELRTGTFSFSNFYSRRIRRIFPALFVILAASLAAGYVILAPGDYAGLAKSATAAAVSLSNVYFNFNTGYFDDSAETIPLLHTWSLGVEEQFYIVLPVFLFLAHKIVARKHLAYLVLAAALLSFAASCWRMQADQKSAFYLMHYRAWEQGAGAFAALIPHLRSKATAWVAQTGTAAGLVLVVYAVCTPHPSTSFPGWGAVPGVLGATLLLSFTGRESVVNRLLSLPPLVFIGKFSYSLYLWHWPLIAFWRHYTGWAPLTPNEQVALGVASVAFGAASWYFIEKPFRIPRFKSWPTIAIGLSAMAILALPAFAVVRSKGLPERLPKSFTDLQSKDAMWQWECPENAALQGEYFCSTGAIWAKAKHRAVVIGDSHGQHLMPLMHEAGLQSDTAIGMVGSCPPIFDPNAGNLHHLDQNLEQRCHESRKQLFDFLTKNTNVQTVIVAGLWPQLGYSVYRSEEERVIVDAARNTNSPTARDDAFKNGSKEIVVELDKLAEDLRTIGVRMIVVSDVPTFDRDPLPCVITNSSALLRRSCEKNAELVSRESMKRFQLPMAEILKKATSAKQAFDVVIPTDALCKFEYCDAYVNGTYIYRDGDHIRRNMSRADNSAIASRIGLVDALKRNARADDAL